MPRALSTLISGASTPRSAKVLSVVTFRCLSGIGVCLVWSRRFARQCQHNVARLPVGKIERRETSSAGCTIHLKSVPSRRFGVAPVVDEEAFHDVSASDVVRPTLPEA